MEFPRVDKYVDLNITGQRSIITFHPEYKPLDPYAANIPKQAASMTDDWLEIGKKMRSAVSCGLSISGMGDEQFGISIDTGPSTDFDERPVLAELTSRYVHPELESEEIQMAFQHFSYSIYDNGIGIMRNVLYISRIGGYDHFSVLNQRYMDNGDRPAVELLANYVQKP